MKILFLIRSLERGGAERQLTLLARGLQAAGHDVAVAVFYAGGFFEESLRTDGIPIHDLAKGGRWDLAGCLARLVRLVRRERPRILHAYLVEPNLFALLPRGLVPGVRVVWGVRASHMALDRYGAVARYTFRLSCLLARYADLIICNSRAGARHHVACGYPEEKTRVIPNGFDGDRFRPDARARADVRREWGIGEGDMLVGLPGRLDPMKDHPTFLRAAARLLARRPRTRFVCIGGGDDALAASLAALARQEGLEVEGRLIWTGSRDDMPRLLPALDLAVSSSIGEGLSNTLGEAMACGVPCVATDVGDSAWLVADTGLVTPPGRPELLADAMELLLDRIAREGAGVGAAARQRILDGFTPAVLVRETLAQLERLA